MNRRGFTLIEVMIAAAILAAMGAMVFGSFQRAYKQKDEVQAADERIGQARTALDRIAADLSVAFLSEHYDRKRFSQRPTLFKGEDRGRADELLFTSLSGERFEADQKTGDQHAVRYFVDRDRDNGARFESLYRRTHPLIDEELERKGYKEVLCENVRSFELQYWDSVKHEWIDEWDTTKPERNGVLPERVRVELVVVDSEGKDKKYVTQAPVMLQRSLDF
jgi:general secretion pathway protein J